MCKREPGRAVSYMVDVVKVCQLLLQLEHSVVKDMLELLIGVVDRCLQLKQAEALSAGLVSLFYPN